MTDNCDMNLFDPENMEIKPGNIDLFIPVGSKMTVSASVDSVYCIGLRTSDRDVELKMSREQAIKLARGILTLTGEELNGAQNVRSCTTCDKFGVDCGTCEVAEND